MESSCRLSIWFRRPVSTRWRKIEITLVSFWRISQYATTSTEKSIYIIGGWTNDPTNTPIIAEYKNDEWHNVGNLEQSRNAHGAITSGLSTMVIGGHNPEYGEPLVNYLPVHIGIKKKLNHESRLLGCRQRYGKSKHLQTKSSLHHYQIIPTANLASLLLM